MENAAKERLKMEDPVTYRICVQGCLEDVWADRLANMTIKMDLTNDQAPVSVLAGNLRDQSELLGVLNGLYQMRVPILLVEIIGTDKVDQQIQVK
jgi:hypothetical protein